MPRFLGEVHPHNHHEGRVRDRITNVVQKGSEVAPDVQLGRQHAV